MSAKCVLHEKGAIRVVKFDDQVVGSLAKWIVFSKPSRKVGRRRIREVANGDRTVGGRPAE